MRITITVQTVAYLDNGQIGSSAITNFSTGAEAREFIAYSEEYARKFGRRVESRIICQSASET